MSGMDFSFMSAPVPQPPTSNIDLNAAYSAERARAKPRPPPAQVAYLEKRKGRLFKIALFATVAFVLLSNNVAYNMANKLYAAFTSHTDHIVDDMGCPTLKGIGIHAGVFFLFMMVLLFSA